MPSKLIMTLQDYDEEFSSVGFEGVTIDGTTYTLATAETELNALISAVLGISLCSHYKNQRLYSFGTITLAPPSDQFAQREHKWLLRYRDDVTNQVYTKEIPGADLSLLDSQAKGFMDTSSAEWTALVAAFEQYVRSPDGNAVTLMSAQHVGRNI